MIGYHRWEQVSFALPLDHNDHSIHPKCHYFKGPDIAQQTSIPFCWTDQLYSSWLKLLIKFLKKKEREWNEQRLNKEGTVGRRNGGRKKIGIALDVQIIHFLFFCLLFFFEKTREKFLSLIMEMKWKDGDNILENNLPVIFDV